VHTVRSLSFVFRFLLVVVLGSAALAGSLALLGPASKSLAHTTTPLPDLNLTINAPAARSTVYDRYGNPIPGGTFATQDRAPVKLRDIPKVLIHAVIAIEDRKFYEHNGVDFGGTIRASLKNVDAGGISQGGSTITQQLVKNTITLNKKRDLKTKIQEAVMAMRLEREMTKNQILQDYLNLVYFGNGAYGVQAAAERYFPGTPLWRLNLPQAALLGGLIQSPEMLNPITHPDAAARRRAEVLQAMVETKYTTAANARAANLVPLPVKLSYPHSSHPSYYLDEVRQVLETDDPNVSGDPGETLGSTPSARARALYTGGLKIYTAYDPIAELQATTAMGNVLPHSPFTAALVVIDNTTGGVRAIVNGRPYSQVQYDPATQASRQPGSSFKVFTLAAALSHGYSPDDTVSGGSLYRPDIDTAWSPLSKDCHGGTPTLREAIAISDNCAFVRTEMSLGPGRKGLDGVDTMLSTAQSMGIDISNFAHVQSATLGTNGVNPLEMAQAYSVLANGGLLHRAEFVTKIVAPGNKVIYDAAKANPPTRVLDPNVAWTETDMLKGVIKHGTAANSLARYPWPAAGKTGTTDGNVDAWFVGYTPEFTAAVWMGNPDGEIKMNNVGGINVFGGTYPARIWGAFMDQAVSGLPREDFPAPNPLLWPPRQYITEYGRQFRFHSGSYSSNTSPPASTPPSTATNATSPTTRAPAPPPAPKQKHKPHSEKPPKNTGGGGPGTTVALGGGP
jgi:penicillin-binding protein 1A